MWPSLSLSLLTPLFLSGICFAAIIDQPGILSGDQESSNHVSHNDGDEDGASEFETAVQPIVPLSSVLQSEAIPWHISNRYYDADVHFLIHPLPLRSVAPSPAQRRSLRSRGPFPDEPRQNVFEILERKPPNPSAADVTNAGTVQNIDRSHSSLSLDLEDVPAVLVIIDKNQVRVDKPCPVCVVD